MSPIIIHALLQCFENMLNQLFVDVVSFKISSKVGVWNGMTSADYYVNGIPTNNLNDTCAIRPTQICSRTYFNVIGNHDFQKVIYLVNIYYDYDDYLVD